ncbi:MAG: bacillithiol biosynthesis deacetylase BshB1 [Cyclobacteriaceae bacterium]
MKLDILIFAAHPDDSELACAGIILNQVEKGNKVGVVDFTQGELGTRGTPELRLQEAEVAKKILGLSVRENLGFRDGFFENDEAHMLQLVESIRKYQPEVVITNAPSDRHPDHGRGYELAKRACFLSGLTKIKTGNQEAWRPREVYHYIQDNYLKPDVIVDITPYWEKKKEAILAFKSQFFSNSDSGEPETYISSQNFLNFIEARSMEMGHSIGVAYGEGLIKTKPVGITDLMGLL